MTWRTALPYTLTFDMRITRLEPMTLIEGRTAGELEGLGRRTLSGAAARTDVRYEWIVAVTGPGCSRRRCGRSSRGITRGHGLGLRRAEAEARRARSHLGY